ncbi:MAG: histidine phosphatase family protein [Chloroflexi bacterium]|nr:histidine phosphatase family protein [Chloroflexota bacterium]
MTRIILVRHGQTAWNKIERFRGRADVPLDEVGLAQAEATGRRVAAQWPLNAVYSSPISRAYHTAQAIAKHFHLPVEVHEGLTDIDFGQWQGLSPDEVRARWPEQLDAWYHTPQRLHIPGGESLDIMRARGMAAVDELTARHDGQTIALVGHTVINRVILLGMLGLGNERFWHIGQDTCAINVIEAQESDFILASLNDTCHLR